MNSKFFLKSKTVLLNLFALLLVVLGFIAENIEAIAPFLPENLSTFLVAVLPPLNIYLRTITDKPVHLK